MTHVRQPRGFAKRRRRYRQLIYGDYVTSLVLDACERLGLSQKQLAAEIGLEDWSLSEYRNGRAHAAGDNRALLIEQLDADPDELDARELADKILYLAESLEVTPAQRARALRLIDDKE